CIYLCDKKIMKCKNNSLISHCVHSYAKVHTTGKKNTAFVQIVRSPDSPAVSRLISLPVAHRHTPNLKIN
ncbi:MAG: hypothetical protein ACK55Z_36090, partial [bacterium]